MSGTDRSDGWYAVFVDPMPRLARTGLLAAVLLTLPPAAAAADDVTVGPERSLAAAVSAAPAGSVITVRGGTHREDVTVDKPLTITGVDGARVVGSIRVEADVTLRTLTVEASAGTAVGVGEPGAVTLNGVSLTRPAGGTSDAPVLDVAGAADLDRSSIFDLGAAPGTPAVRTTGAGGVRAVSSTLLSSAGPAFVATASAANVLRRSTAVTTARAADALQLRAGSPGGRFLIVDASFVIGGADAAGVRVATQGAPANDVSTLVLRHATVFGAGRGIVLDGSGLTAGSIAAGAQASIVHEPSIVRGASPLNEVALNFSHSDSPGCAERSGGAACGRPQQFTPDPSLLFGRDLHLRADAPVVDRGPRTAPDPDLALDIDGQGRPIGAATDIGADEFLNVAPTARLVPSTSRPRTGQVVTFSSTVTDPNVGDRVAAYAWDFGDGKQVASDVPIMAHAYRRPGTYTAALATIDARGLTSATATAKVTVRDTRPPVVRIGRARAAADRLVASGRQRDAAGVATVQVALTRTEGKRCGQFTGRRMEPRPCERYTWLPAVLERGRWSYAARALALPPGRYVLRARGTDTGGRTSGADRARVRLRVR